jgi:hypothetical protein
MTDIDLKAEAVKAGFPPEAVIADEFAPKLDVAQMNYTEHFFWKILAATAPVSHHAPKEESPRREDVLAGAKQVPHRRRIDCGAARPRRPSARSRSTSAIPAIDKLLRR